MPTDNVAQKKGKRGAVVPMPETMAAALENLNEKICYLHEGSKIAELAPGRIRNHKIPLIDCHTFQHEAYAPLTIEGKSVAQAWLKWPGRRTAQRKVYVPNESRFVDGNLNCWFPSASKPKKGDISLFHTYMAGIMELDPQYLDWLTAWLAYHVQRPNKKMLTAVMLWSPETGNGKSTLGHLMRRIHGEHNSFLLRTKFPERFNSYAENTLFGLIDELSPVRKTGQSDAIKAMITQPRILIENKQQRAYEQDDIISYIFTSNHPNALDLSPDDRRFFVHRVGTALTRSWHESTFQPWLRTQEAVDAIHDYLLNDVDLSKPIIGGNPESLDPAPFDPSKIAPRNAARDQAIRDNRDDMEAWIWELKENPVAILGPDEAARTIFTSEELFSLFREQIKMSNPSKQRFQQNLASICAKLYGGNPINLPDRTRPRLYSTEPGRQSWTADQVRAAYLQEKDS